MYFLYIIKLFSFIAYFANSSLAVTFWIALVTGKQGTDL
jgi:hypothetical protein